MTSTHLSRHDPLPLRYQVTSGAGAILELTMSFVSFEPANHTMVPAASTFRLSGALFRGGVAEPPTPAHAIHPLHHASLHALTTPSSEVILCAAELVLVLTPAHALRVTLGREWVDSHMFHCLVTSFTVCALKEAHRGLS